jgi:hypothetical protein
LAFLLVSCLFAWAGSARSEGIAFQEKPISITDYNLKDLGVADLDGDGVFDIFTTNCWALPGIFPGDGHGGFQGNVLTQWKLDHDPRFPGLEVTGQKPLMDSPGLYIYWHGMRLVLYAFGTESMGGVAGKLTLLSRATYTNTKTFQIKHTETTLPQGAVESTFEFSTKHWGKLVITPYLMEIPDHFVLSDTGLSPDQIFVGLGRSHPSTLDFTLLLKDRHGMAWADFNGDDLTDVFIGSGGLKGLLPYLPLEMDDELMVNQGDHFENITESAGIRKDRYNRGRQVAWVDFDGDGRLDLYIHNLNTPNQLYRQKPDGTFTDVAPRLGLDFDQGGPFVWLDADGDGDMDLFTVTKKSFTLCINKLNEPSGGFEIRAVCANKGGIQGNLSVADYDLDGDLDIFSSTWAANTLLVNSPKGFEAIPLGPLGLPEKSRTASFVDYDNDGYPDLHIVPGGLYRQNRTHKFTKTGRFEKTVPAAACDARTIWFDADSNGFFDLLLTYTMNFNYPLKWRTRFFTSLGSANHWLGLRLIGPPGNRQAIGARVLVRAGGREQLQQVGQSEGSHYSQGNFLLHFGLGTMDTVDAVKVFWPDGSTRELKGVAGNQTVLLRRDDP